MANRRTLKKQIKKQTNELIEDAFIESINGAEKEAKKMDQLVDELIDDRFELISKVSDYPKKKDAKTIKSHFSELKDEVKSKVDAYRKKIGKVG